MASPDSKTQEEKWKSDPWDAFEAGVWDGLERWDALTISVGLNGGDDTRAYDVREFFYHHILDLYTGPKKPKVVHAEQLESLLENKMNEKCRTQVEDGSIEWLARLVVQLHADCVQRKDFTGLSKMLAASAALKARRNVVQAQDATPAGSLDEVDMDPDEIPDDGDEGDEGDEGDDGEVDHNDPGLYDDHNDPSSAPIKSPAAPALASVSESKQAPSSRPAHRAVQQLPTSSSATGSPSSVPLSLASLSISSSSSSSASAPPRNPSEAKGQPVQEMVEDDGWQTVSKTKKKDRRR